MKIKFLIFLFFCMAFVFHKQILGLAAKWAIEAQTDCQFAYRSLEWKKGGLIFSDVILSDPNFHSHIEKASIDFDWSAFPKKCKGHLTLNRPHVSLMKLCTLPEIKQSWFDFTVSAVEGTVEWKGIARFSFDQNHLCLDWGGSGAILAFDEGEIEADLNHFKAELLQPWVPYGEISSGFITGRINIGHDQKLHFANLKVDRMAFELPHAFIEDVAGTISYNANLGLKWELQGLGNAQAKFFPFTCQGRQFFKSQWLETEVKFGDSFFKLSGDEMWALECAHLSSQQATLLQSCASFFWPEISKWSLTGGILSGKGLYGPKEWSLEFEGRDLNIKKEKNEFFCSQAKGSLSQTGGELALNGTDFDVKLSGTWEEWRGDVRIFSALFSLQGGWDGEKFPIVIEKGVFDAFRCFGKGWIDPNFDFFLTLDGVWDLFQREVPFRFPYFSKQGEEYGFDFRLERKSWDLVRLAGTFNGKELFFNEKSHLLGAKLQFGPCSFDTFDVEANLPLNSILASAPLFREWDIDLGSLPFKGNTQLHFRYAEGSPMILAKSDQPSFEFHASQSADLWTIELVSDLILSAQYNQKEGSAKGKGKWKTGAEAQFEGKISPAFHAEFTLTKVHFDLAEIDQVSMEGELDGQGHLIYDNQLEADLDLLPSGLKINGHFVENEGPIHLNYSSINGVHFRGLNLHGPFDCVVDLLEYDILRSHWIFHNSQMHLPGSFLTHRFLKFLDPDLELNFTADLNFASDFSTFTCFMREGSIPFNQCSYHIENLELHWDRDKCKASFDYLNHRHSIQLHVDEKISGRVILGQETSPLTIDWEYENELAIQAIEGAFGGLEASFHAESPDTLVGSARLNFTELSKWIPANVAKVFDEIKMGKGFDLKGRLTIENNTPSFHGILSGKALELFSFQFRTLLAQVELTPNLIHIYDAKISDKAGVMKIDEVLIEGKKDEPWTIFIPKLTILDMRPSLLKHPGGEVGPISPLVVRELVFKDFQGLLDDGKTWTAQGQLHFINSYKREETVFDLPANVFSRIVGLDLELLIPVRGNLTFELKEGVFILKELANAFSEAERSEFFLVTDPPPLMDLDGNLQIYIKMKQFVLFKITESFLISIEGKLNDPQFHLRKKRFFGLL